MCVLRCPFVFPYFLESPFLGGNCSCAGNISECFTTPDWPGYLLLGLRFRRVGGAVAAANQKAYPLSSFASCSPLSSSCLLSGEIIPFGVVTALVKISFYSWATRAFLMTAISHVHTGRAVRGRKPHCPVAAPEEDGKQQWILAQVNHCSLTHWFTACCFSLAPCDISTQYKGKRVRLLLKGNLFLQR